MEDDIAIQLSDAKAQEFSDFDTTVEPEGTWGPPRSMITLHFNHCLLSAERQAILCDFPKPNCSVLDYTDESDSNKIYMENWKSYCLVMIS